MRPRAGRRPRGSCAPGAFDVRPGAGESGFVGGFEGLLFGFLLFVAGTLLIVHAWAVLDTKTATEEAARQAARTYVAASSAAVAASSAEMAAADALTGYGRQPSMAKVGVATGSFGRCQRVTISVSYPAPLLVLPFVGRLGTAEEVRSVNSQLVDPYRSGLPGTATCA
jgi:cytochrome bd-type quinol oxidase subunit 2